MIRSHPVLSRDGDDLELEVPITVLEAMRGATITVPTPTGDIRLTVDPGVRLGTRLRIRGRGVQRKGKPGDLYVVLRPTVPPTDDPDALAAAECLEQAYPTDPRADPATPAISATGTSTERRVALRAAGGRPA